MKKTLPFIALVLAILVTAPGFAQKKKDKAAAEPQQPDTLQAYFQKCMDKVKVGMPAPPFKYVNSRGDSVAQSDFKGKYLVLDIWATWCAPCIQEIPFFEEVKIAFKNDNVAFVSISLDDSREDWKKYLLKKRMGGNQLWAGKQATPVFWYSVQDNKTLGFKGKGLNSGIPAFVVIDPQGKIVNNFAPYPSHEDELEKLLISLPGLKKK